MIWRTEVEVEFKEEEGRKGFECVGGRGGVQGGRGGGTVDLVDVGRRGGVQGGRTGRFESFGGRGEFMEEQEEEQVFWGCWWSKWSSRRKRRRNKSF